MLPNRDVIVDRETAHGGGGGGVAAVMVAVAGGGGGDISRSNHISLSLSEVTSELPLSSILATVVTPSHSCHGGGGVAAG